MFRQTNLLLLTLLTSVNAAFASTTTSDFFESTGKIYVVIACIAVIFTGIIFYIIHLDRKLTRLENQIKNNE